MADRRRRGAGRPAARRGTIGLRLALAFLGVALVAIALVAGLTAAFSAADVSALAGRERAQLATAVSVAAGAAWDRRHSWAAADLAPVLDLAARTGAESGSGTPPGGRWRPRPGSPGSLAPSSAGRSWCTASGWERSGSGSAERAWAARNTICAARSGGPSPGPPG